MKSFRRWLAPPWQNSTRCVHCLVFTLPGERGIAHDFRACFWLSGCCRSSLRTHRRRQSLPRLNSGFRRKFSPSDLCVQNISLCMAPFNQSNPYAAAMSNAPIIPRLSNAFDSQDDQPERASLLASIQISRIADEVVEMKRILLVCFFASFQILLIPSSGDSIRSSSFFSKVCLVVCFVTSVTRKRWCHRPLCFAITTFCLAISCTVRRPVPRQPASC